MKLKELLERNKKPGPDKNTGLGSKNSAWVGKNPEKESTKHERQKAKKGPASKYTCKESGCESGKNMEWAQLKGGGWKAMCKSCHSKYDGKHKNINKGKKRD